MAIRRTRRPSRLTDALADRDSAGGPDAVRARLLDAVLEVGEADAAGWFSAGEVDGVPRLASWQTAAAGDRSFDACLRLIAASPDPWGGAPLDFRRAARIETAGFQEIDSLVERSVFESSEFFRTYFLPFRIADQIRLLVFQGPRFIGWIGAVRKTGRPRFDARDRRRFATLVAPITEALCAIDAAQRQALPAEGAVVVLHPDGEVDYASIPSISWLDRPGFRESLRAAAITLHRGEPRDEWKTLIDDAECRLIRVDGGDTVRYVATLTPSRQLHRSFDHALTEVQRRVAASAAAGATIAEIAADLGRGAETVRSHLREIYRRLEVSSRLELARALQKLDGEE